MSIPQKLTCPITNCLYPVVSSQCPEVFMTYYRKIQNRLKQDEKITLCFHCETFFYGKNNDYIILIQMAELSNKFKYEAHRVPNDLSIKLKNGIILISPFREDFIKMLTNIFNSSKIEIITYDIFNQFSLIMSEGINFQFTKPIIDAEFTDSKGKKMLHQKYVHPILNCTTKKCSGIKINKNNEINQFNYQYELQYKLSGVKNPLKNGFDSKFWKFFVKNCAFITVALISSIDQVGYNQQKEFTNKKLRVLSKTQDEYEDYFVPLILKDFYSNKEFFSSNFEISKCPFKVWTFAQTIINNFDLYNTVVLENEDISKRLVNNLRRNAENAIHDTDKKDSSSLQNKTKKGILIINSFVQKYGKTLNDLKLIWTVLQPKFQLIEAKLDPNDQIYRILNEAFKNINIFEAAPPTEVTKDQRKLMINNVRDVLDSIHIFFDFLLDKRTKKESQKIESQLFKLIFNPFGDDSYLTSIYSVYKIHDEFIYTNRSYVLFKSSTGSGKTRCAPFYLAIRAIQEDLIHPFIIMTQPSTSIIRDKLNDFNKLFGKTVLFVYSIPVMLKMYKKFNSKHEIEKPVIGLFSPMNLLKLVYEAKGKEIEIFPYTRFCLDEIHERSIETDVLVSILSTEINDLIVQRRNFPLQCLMMSATPDERILKCFGDNVLQIDIPESQTFPITEIKQEVEDKEDINDAVISHTFNIIKEMSKEDGKVEPGHILIFLSGNSRMNEIQTKIFDDAEKECSSDECTVVVMKQFKSMFQKGDIQRFYHRLDSYIKKETNRINAEDDKKKILFILPIKYGSYVSNEQKMIGKNPIKSHPNLIKVIMATNAIESSITIDSLAAVVDSGIFNHSTYNKENGLTTLTEKPISIQNQIQRRGRVGRTMPGVYVSIQLKNEKLMKSLPPAILTSDISLNILSLRKIGCKLENITNLPDKLSKAEIKKYKSELVKFNALTDKTYELTPFGDFLGSFPMLSPFIASAILTVAGYTNDENQIKKNILKESEKELKLLLGILISLIIGSKDICINKYSKKLKKFFDKRSDIITFVCSIIDLSRFKGKEINANANKYGLNGPIVIKIINQIQQTAQSLFETNALKDNTKFNKRDNKRMDSDDISDDEDDDNQEEEEYEENDQKDDENENKIIKNPLHELRNYVKKLVDGDQLYQFIQKLIVEIGNNKPDWISCRRVSFKTIEKASFNPSFVYLGDKSLSFAKGKDNSFITLKMRPGFVGLDSPGSAFILSITHDNNTKLNYGSMIHCDLENEANKEILHPVSVETSAALDNDFSIPLIESYMKNDIEHFQKFHSNGFSDSKENTSFFKDSQDCSFDPNNQLKKKYYRFSFIPKDERAIQVFKESIIFIENLMPYTPSTILIQHPNLKTIISLHGIGTDIIDSSVHLHNDTDYYAYKLTKESIIFLNQNIGRLGAINESYSIAMTGEWASYPLDSSIDCFSSIQFSENAPMPYTISESKYVFNNEFSHLIMTSTKKIDELNDYSLTWISDEVKTEILDDNDIFLQEANAIARDLIQFEKSFYYLVFKTSEAELKVNDEASTDQLPNDNKISNLISYYANNNNQGETFIPLTNFKEFSYKGKELEKIDQNEQINYKTIDLGNACFCIEVNNKNKIDEIQNQVINNFKEKGITVSAEIVPVYTATVKHSIFSDLNRKEFIEHLNIIIKQFGAIIIKNNKYVNNKNNKQSSDQGFIKVLMYSSFFTVPFARLIKNEFQQAIQYSILKIPRNVVDQFILTNNSVIKVLTGWFEEKNLQIKNKNNIWYGPENDVKKALQEFKVNPPKIPYNEYPIQGQFNLHQINDKVEAINKKIRKQVLNQIEPLDQKQKPKLKTKSTELLIDEKINLWKLNPRNRTLFIPNDTPEEQISNFFEQLNSLSDQTIVIDKFKLDEDEDEKNIDQILYDIDFHEDDSLRSRYLINIFFENGKLIQRNFCVDCIYETLQYNLGKIYDENDDCASYQDMYNSDQFIPIISFVPCKNVPNDKDPTFVQVFPIIPFGQIVWAFLNEPKIANIERTYITCLAVQSLFKSPKITHCPVHPSNLSIKPPIGSTQKCSIPNCKFQLCPICNKWHAVGECEEMIVPPGTRECPFCHQIVEKSQACNHIFCRCGHHFCYYCGEGFDDDQKTYAHMHHQNHWEEAPDYKKFIKNESVSDEDLQQFYEKYPKLKPKWNGY